ncbi:hypothetical protein OEB99_06525 [Actinotalea sp. M2MS4P-6]|uniref:hypothetical protein n=1 Tax=Actinotalea sp. M2MS4P-6 TaxID=2983762 RepID=UPI0021E4DDE8|nr:hypothetical protein [Actinotalea sp. M2MS4P-6]MCV2393956.1 hypothetical protein [Actinotalea sp. M2MS4P-6]
MRTSLWRGVGVLAGATLVLAATMTGAGAAQGDNGPPSGSGRGGDDASAANSLSVPTVMVDGGFADVSCPDAAPGALETPTGEPSTGYLIDPTAYFYVQGLNRWQAQCYTAPTATADAAWGDNLTGAAALTVNSPIRVELGLLNSDGEAPSMTGYTVDKLSPSALDRESDYGTLATGSVEDGFSATPTTFAATEQRVYDGGVTFSVRNDTTGAFVVHEGTAATAEINATGKVVYGYNLRVTSAGSYTITFVIPTVTVTGTDAGTFLAHSVALQITVTGGHGGGGGGGHGPVR